MIILKSGFDCYRKFVALKLHFSSETYDYFKFNKQTKLKTGKFESRPDKYYFQKVATLYDTEETLEDFLVSNILWRYGEFFITDALTEESKCIYKEYVRNKQSFRQSFADDIKVLKEHCEKNNINNYLFVQKNKYPELLTLLQQNMIRLESVFALNKIMPFLQYWKSKIEDNIIWPEIYKKILKFEPFCASIDRITLIREYNKIMVK